MSHICSVYVRLCDTDVMYVYMCEISFMRTICRQVGGDGVHYGLSALPRPFCSIIKFRNHLFES